MEKTVLKYIDWIVFAAQQKSPRSEALMQIIDKINQGRLGKVYFAARGRDTREWMMKWGQLSPNYTTAARRAADGEVMNTEGISISVRSAWHNSPLSTRQQKRWPK